MLKTLIATAGTAALLCGAGSAGAITLVANAAGNNGGSPNWGLFFDLTAGGSDLTVTDLSTASTALAGASFSLEVYTRSGSALGGPVGVGNAASGWQLLGTAAAVQGAEANGISNLIDIPDIRLNSGQVTGVALLFRGAGPRYFGSGTAPLQSFSDSFLTLTTGDVRSAPFTTGGSFFSSRGLAGSVVYAPVPEPMSVVLMGLGLAGLAWRFRKS